VRRFERRPVEPELLDRLIALTAAAPSVGYSQPARFVRVEDPAPREAIVLEYERANDEAAATYSPARAPTPV
jgi:5,6-dimethylbenzimidazole synthase